jgi:hypothetical protein
MTRKQYLRILIALIDVDSLGIAAKVQGTDKIVVNIPYEFVAVENTYGRHIWSESWTDMPKLTPIASASQTCA